MTNKRPKPTVISTDPAKNIECPQHSGPEGDVVIDKPDAIIVDVQLDAHPVGSIEEIKMIMQIIISLMISWPFTPDGHIIIIVWIQYPK